MFTFLLYFYGLEIVLGVFIVCVSGRSICSLSLVGKPGPVREERWGGVSGYAGPR